MLFSLLAFLLLGFCPREFPAHCTCLVDDAQISHHRALEIFLSFLYASHWIFWVILHFVCLFNLSISASLMRNVFTFLSHLAVVGSFLVLPHFLLLSLKLNYYARNILILLSGDTVSSFRYLLIHISLCLFCTILFLDLSILKPLFRKFIMNIVWSKITFWFLFLFSLLFGVAIKQVNKTLWKYCAEKRQHWRWTW